MTYEAALIDQHIALLAEARRERDHHKQNASDYAEALSAEQAINADLLAALEAICDRAIGNSTGSFTIGIGHIKHARAIIAKAKP